MSNLGAVVVGGVGEGLGFAVSARFARAGHPVVMLARTQERLDRFAAEIAGQGGAINREQRAIGSATSTVQRAGDKLLAGTTFPTH